MGFRKSEIASDVKSLKHWLWDVDWFLPLFPSSVDVYSYDEDDMVLDPNLAEHLAHFGIDMLKMQKVRRDDRMNASCGRYWKNLMVTYGTGMVLLSPSNIIDGGDFISFY